MAYVEQAEELKKILVENPKPNLKTILGYGFASAADSTAYNFTFMFLLYFLTTAVGVNPAIAGTIMMAATLLDAVTTPVIGYLSDNCISKFGRRRPFILAGGVALSIVVVLLFTKVPFTGTAQAAYYLIFTILFWISYSSWYVPYTAFGAEIAVDYDSRTKLRLPATIFNGLGNLIGMAAPMVIISAFVSAGASQSGAWTAVAAIVGLIVLITILITWKMTKGKELRPTDEELKLQKRQGIFSTYLKVIRLKPYKFMALSAVCFMAAYTLMMTDMLYYITCVMQASETVQSQASLIFMIAAIIMTPIVSAVAIKIGKKRTVVLCFMVSAACMILFRLIGIHSILTLDLYLITFTICNSAYWTLIPAMGYDLSEVYEVKYKQQREGAVLSLNVFFVKVSAAVMSGITGSILAFTGYNPSQAVQSEAAISGISNLFTIVPAILLFFAALIMMCFPLTKKKHEMLIQMIDEGTYDQRVPQELKKIL